MPERIKTFKEFYPYYLNQHSKKFTRIFHFTGTLLVLGVIIFVLQSGKERFLWYLPIFGWGFSAFSHYVFEKNKPASFKQPLYSFISDWRMLSDILRGNLSLKDRKFDKIDS